jgi:hypothetical protein
MYGWRSKRSLNLKPIYNCSSEIGLNVDPWTSDSKNAELTTVAKLKNSTTQQKVSSHVHKVISPSQCNSQPINSTTNLDELNNYRTKNAQQSPLCMSFLPCDPNSQRSPRHQWLEVHKNVCAGVCFWLRVSHMWFSHVAINLSVLMVLEMTVASSQGTAQ